MPDVVIAGAGIVGCATAVHLLDASPGLDVVLVEPDPTYARAATGRGTGGVRQLFTRPENIALSQYTLDEIDDWDRWAGGNGPCRPLSSGGPTDTVRRRRGGRRDTRVGTGGTFGGASIRRRRGEALGQPSSPCRRSRKPMNSTGTASTSHTPLLARQKRHPAACMAEAST